MEKIHYFAYGSNLHPVRLQERVPSANVIAMVAVKGRKLTFSKIGKDQSGKCSMYDSGNPEDIVFGALYEFDLCDKEKLDKFESKGYGYNEQLMRLELADESYTSFTYIADSKYVDGSLQPYDWYKQFVVEGARYHAMPEQYISWLENVVAIPDLDPQRACENMARLNAMKEYNESGERETLTAPASQRVKVSKGVYVQHVE